MKASSDDFGTPKRGSKSVRTVQKEKLGVKQFSLGGGESSIIMAVYGQNPTLTKPHRTKPHSQPDKTPLHS